MCVTTIVCSILAVSVSVVSLVVSGTHFYYAYLRKHARLMGLLLCQDFDVKGECDCELEYGLTNLGNVQLLLRRVYAGQVRELPYAKCAGVPMVIEPGQVITIRVPIRWAMVRKSAEEQPECVVVFQFFSARGEEHEAIHNLIPLVKNDTTTAYAPFDLREPKLYPV